MSERVLDYVDECYLNSDLSLLNKLTLIIPTYNRNYYFSRCLWYHAHFPFGQIIVADSSPEDKKVVNRDTVEKIRLLFNTNILYLEYEPENEQYGGDIYQKWANAVLKVNTEYSQICTDKEFVIPSSVQSSLEYLEEHANYVCADGRYYLIKNSIKPTINIWRQPQRSIDDDTKRSRIGAYTRYSDPLMAVHRSNIQKKIYSKLDEIGLNTLGFKERFIDVYTIFLGKYYHNAESPFSFRDITRLYNKNGLDKSQSSYARYPTIFQYPEDIYTREYCIFRYFFETELTMSKKESEKFDTWLTAYLNSYQTMFDKHTRLAKLWRVLSKSKIIRDFKFYLCSRRDDSKNMLFDTQDIEIILRIMNKEICDFSQ